MATIATHETLAPEGKFALRSYPPSWLDRLTDWVRTLPMPPWLFYLILAVALVVIEAAVKWSDGS